MKDNADKTPVWPLWLIILIAGGGVIITLFIGNIIVIGSKLGAIHRYAEWCFYAAVLILSFVLIVRPLFAVLFAPVVSLEKIADCEKQTDHKTLKRVCKQILKSPALTVDQRGELEGALERGSDLRGPLSAAINAQIESATKIIHEHAVLVFVSTAVSQNGRLDTIAVLIANFRLVHRLVNHFGYRPPLPALIKIYAQIFITALVANEMDDLDLEGGFGQFGLGMVAAIPGATLLANSVLDGTINALFTLRVGFVARKCLLNAGADLIKAQIRTTANSEARKELRSVCIDAAKVLPSAIKEIVQKIV